ncbi:recombination-associated protein RdgC [Paraneptunicella aestuarii]|uniref:recombination-associated protein RdgC n=1 Tax=Paraneptunicella aestuarii TaxID=2831148 RepID=UPI001E3C2874|nr:recombination-associated protein RdgC [Paraneptunicella aestuarii]UAA38009.1 recombination-associated protein RdgC [Paraneptunicella aestuarii]
MWFKNLKLYRLTEQLKIDEEALQDLLTENAFRPCGSQELASMGWTNPLGQGESLFHAANGNYWFTLKKQERILPAAVINAELDEKVAQIESDTGNPVGKKAKQDLKQEITHKLLPQAFTKNSVIHGFVAPKHNFVLIDAAADGKSETFLAMLRKTLGSLPVVPLARTTIAQELTDWLASDSWPRDIELLEEAEFKDPTESGSIVRVKNQDLFADEIRAHIEAGKQLHKVALSWKETLTAILQEDLTVKRIKFSDVMREENDDIPKDEMAARADADFALMAGELIKLAEWLVKEFDLKEE